MDENRHEDEGSNENHGYRYFYYITWRVLDISVFKFIFFRRKLYSPTVLCGTLNRNSGQFLLRLSGNGVEKDIYTLPRKLEYYCSLRLYSVTETFDIKGDVCAEYREKIEHDLCLGFVTAIIINLR